ncbi:MAG TPA: histidine phosphatase family protein [Allosphingosinicella sp.]|nr:histidine phosphatase family protein [Allosphingosinicella sp.]
MPDRWFVARHGETVFNAVGRIQGDAPHTPLTRAGFAQAEKMGEALRARLGARPDVKLWSSTAGRALQTLAVIAEHLELDWHDARTDGRLGEIGMGEWGGRYYRDLGPVLDPATHLFTRPAPGGEWYDGIARRLQDWIDDTRDERGDRIVLMHGMSSRVLRGMLIGAEARPEWGAPVAPSLPQGSVAEVGDGSETVLCSGSGGERS